MKLFSSLKNTAKTYLSQYEQHDPATYAAAQEAVGGLLILDGFVGISNPLSRNKRPGIFGSIGGIIFGIVFMFIPLVFNSFTGMNKMTATTTATVVSVGTPVVSQSTTTNSSGSTTTSSTCSLTVHYVVDGISHTSTSVDSSSSNCSQSVGNTLTINYNPQNPSSWSANAKSFGLFMSLFFWAGLLAAITSFITFLIRLASIIFGWKLLKSGRALAKTLPQGTNLQTIIEEIREHFKGSIFGVPSPVAPPTSPFQAAATTSAVTPSQTPTPSPVPPVSPTPITGMPPTSPAPSITPIETPVAPMTTAAAPIAPSPETRTSPAPDPNQATETPTTPPTPPTIPPVA